MPEIPISEKREKLFKEFKERDVDLEKMYKRTMRVLDEHLTRHEKAMFDGLAYKGDFDPKLAKAAESLGRIIERLTKLHIQRLEKGREQLETMSIDEQLSWVVKFIESLPVGYRREMIDRISTQLMLKINRRNPDGRPANNWVHPMDRK